MDRSLWGEIEHVEEGMFGSSLHNAEYSQAVIESEEESEEEEEEEEEEKEAEKPAGNVPADGLETPSGLATPSGYNSVVSTVPGGLETPDFMDLRKNTRAQAEDVPSRPKELYQVIPERETTSRGIMGSSTAYDIGGASKGSGLAVLGAEDNGRKVSPPRQL